MLDCLFRFAHEDEQIRHFRDELCVVWIEFARARIFGHRLVVLAVVQIGPSKRPVSLIVVGIEAHRRGGHIEREFEGFGVVARPLVVEVVGIGPAEADIGARVVRIDFLGLLEQIARGRIALGGEFVPLVPTSHKVVVGGEAVRVFRGKARDLRLGEFAAQAPERSGDGARDVVANGEDALDLPVIAFGPEFAPGQGIDQLRRYAQVLIGALDASIDNVMNTQIFAHLPDVRRLALVGKACRARHDQKLGNLRQAVDQLLGNSIGKILLVVGGAQIVEWQNGERRVFGKRHTAARQGVP